MENKEMKYRSMTLREFQEYWYKAENDQIRQDGELDYIIVVDWNGTQIIGNDYYIIGSVENPLIVLTYKEHKTGEIYLKYVKLVY